MAGNVMLDVAIGLAMMYLLGALFCTIIQEWLAGWLQHRAHNLHDAIGHLLDGKKTAFSPDTVTLLSNPLVNLAKTEAGKLASTAPSYLAARNFSLALMQTLGVKSKDGKIDSTELDAKIEASKFPDALKATLKSVVGVTTDDANQTLAAIDVWYDSMMDRASGWYKRRAQLISLVLGGFIAFAAGMDTIGMANRLAHDPNLRQQMAAMAAAATADKDASFEKTKLLVSHSLAQALGTNPDESQAPPVPPKKKDTETEPERQQREAAEVKRAAWDKARNTLADQIGGKSAAPFGVSEWSRSWENGFAGVMSMIVGCLISAVAISLGAPFWYGVLQQLNAIRGAGPKPPVPSKVS